MYETSFDHCLHHWSKELQNYENINLLLNWKNCHFVAQEGAILGHIVSNKGTEVDKAKVEVIEKLLSPNSVKGVRSFLEHVGFYRRFIKVFSKIAKLLTQLLIKNVPFDFYKSV